MSTKKFEIESKWNSFYSSTCCATLKVTNKKISSNYFKRLFDTEVWICYYHTRYHAISYHFFRQPNILDFHHDCLGCQKPNLCNHFQKERHCSPKPNFLPGKQSHSNENYTVWKFQNFSASQILLEINFWQIQRHQNHHFDIFRGFES